MLDVIRLSIFERVYREQLAAAVAAHPEEYPWAKPHVIRGNAGSVTVPAVTVAEVVARMIAAMERGSYSKDSRAFRGTCKQLGIRHTYQAITAYLAG